MSECRFPILHSVANTNIVSELNWTWPNRFRAELPLLASLYGRLHGIDGLYFFASSNPFWARMLGKFSIADPMIMGQFPAAALIFRQGLLKEADIVQSIELSTTDMFGFRGAELLKPMSFDSLRFKDIESMLRGLAHTTALSTDPLLPLVGPVALNVVDDRPPSSAAHFANLIDRQQHTVRSATGELLWNWGRGLVTLDAKAAQVAVGFLGHAERIELSEMAVQMACDVGAIALVSLDGKSIQTSARLLLQVVTEATNTGWATKGNGLKMIKTAGHLPIIVRSVRGLVQLKRPDANHLRVGALDFDGRIRRLAKSGADHISLQFRIHQRTVLATITPRAPVLFQLVPTSFAGDVVQRKDRSVTSTERTQVW